MKAFPERSIESKNCDREIILKEPSHDSSFQRILVGDESQTACEFPRCLTNCWMFHHFGHGTKVWNSYVLHCFTGQYWAFLLFFLFFLFYGVGIFAVTIMCPLPPNSLSLCSMSKIDGNGEETWRIWGQTHRTTMFLGKTLRSVRHLFSGCYRCLWKSHILSISGWLYHVYLSIYLSIYLYIYIPWVCIYIYTHTYMQNGAL